MATDTDDTRDLRGPTTAEVADKGCPPDDELVAFLEGELQPRARRELEDHLDRCNTCRAAIGHVVASEPPRPARTLVRYRLDAEAGSGGMGVVWRAWDLVLERVVAVKLVNPELTGLNNDLWRQRVLREARAMARLHHPNVVAVFDAGEADGEMFIATEFIDGESLDRWQRGRRTTDLLAAYVQAAHGLYAAHRIGLVHRDVKPSNILVARDGRVCVGDFGLATSARTTPLPQAQTRLAREAVPEATTKAAIEAMTRPATQAMTGTTIDATINAGPEAATKAATNDAPSASPGQPLPRLTMTGAVLGTPAYMAPEQHRGEEVDARADQYALCLALAEALLGRRPPVAPSAADLAASGVDAPWEAIARGLAMQPGERFADLRPLITALERHQPRARRRRRRLMLGGLVLAAGLGTAGVASFAHRAAEAPELRPFAWTPDLPWTWTASDRGPWRLPAPGSQIELLDERTAVIAVDKRPDELMTIDLPTGEAHGPRRVVDKGNSIDAIRRIGDRVLGFGHAADKTFAIWQIDRNPLRADPLTVPDPDTPSGKLTAVAASPDGSRIVVCSARRPLVVRDASSLAVLRTLPSTTCSGMHFSDDTHVVAEMTREFDVIEGTERTLPDDALDAYAGPGGHRLVQRDEGPNTASNEATVRVGDRVTQTAFVYDEPRWTPDGVAIAVVNGEVTLRPAPGGVPRITKLVLPDATGFAVDAQHAIVLSNASVQVVDLATGASQQATGAFAAVQDVAPRGGELVAATERLRVWRRGELRVEDPLEVYAVRAAAPPARVAINGSAVALWDVATRQRAVITAENDLSVGTVLEARGEEVWFTTDRSIERSRAGGPPQPWVSFRDNLNAIVLVPDQWIALTDEHQIIVIDARRRLAWSWERGAGCKQKPAVAFLRDQPAAIVHGAHGIELAAFTTGERVRRFDLATRKIAIAPRTGELVAAIGRDITLWPPGATSALTFRVEVPAGTSATALQVDPNGNELAIGFDTGAVAWAWLDQLRAHATPRLVRELDPSDASAACLVGTAQATTLEALGVTLRW